MCRDRVLSTVPCRQLHAEKNLDGFSTAPSHVLVDKPVHLYPEAQRALGSRFPSTQVYGVLPSENTSFSRSITHIIILPKYLLKLHLVCDLSF